MRLFNERVAANLIQSRTGLRHHMNAITGNNLFSKPRCESDIIFTASNGDLECLKEKLLSHDLYGAVVNVRALQVFMEAHVFAVWDFMSLAKSLQIALTCTQLPWFPPEDASSARFVNEIILNEESDLSQEGQAQSHLEMYLDAMKEVGASTAVFDNFLFLLKNGKEVEEALNLANVPEHIARFVTETLNISMGGSIVEVASYFLYGREDPIPDMFNALINRWDVSDLSVNKLRWYLDRHIELDGDEHGPAAQKLLQQVTRGEPDKIRLANCAAQNAIQARINLWSGILQDIAALESTSAQ